jgi:hypothetical protein
MNIKTSEVCKTENRIYRTRVLSFYSYFVFSNFSKSLLVLSELLPTEASHQTLRQLLISITWGHSRKYSHICIYVTAASHLPSKQSSVLPISVWQPVNRDSHCSGRVPGSSYEICHGESGTGTIIMNSCHLSSPQLAHYYDMGLHQQPHV